MSTLGPRGYLDRATARLGALTPVGRDALCYGLSAVFAGVAALAMGIPLYRQWGAMAVGPYAAAALLTGAVAWWARRRRAGGDRPPAPPPAGGAAPAGGASGGSAGRAGRHRGLVAARIAAFAVALVGALLVPLSLEVVWASQGNASLHVQPEVLVVERAGVRASHGHDPYQVVDHNGHIVLHVRDEPVYELYYPYLPGMVLFGFSSGSRVEARLTDARIQFLLFTVIVALIALSRVRPPGDARTRALMLLTVLPTAALPLATGGDDMPVVVLMLAGLVALQRRRPLVAGLALGAASSLKFTAWPLLVLAAWAAADRERRRAVGRYAAGAVVVLLPVVLPFALSNPSAFVDNVIRFPLGLAGVASPAASPLPGHLFVSAFPALHRAYVVAVAVIGLAVTVVVLRRHPPRDAAGVASLTGWLMLAAIVLAPATRVGYLLYPINLFAWAWMLRGAADPVDEASPPEHATGEGDQLPSPASWKSSSEKGVVPADVVGETTTPTSQ